MIISSQEFFGALGIILSLSRYSTYILAICRGTTKPHALTWLGAGLMAGIATVIQFIEQAGPTAYVTAVVTFFCIGIGIAAIFKGEKHFTRSDWISFGLALAIIPFWLLTKQPAVALILVCIIELLNYYPTVRKSYMKPQEEDIVSWSLSALRWLAACFASDVLTITVLLYPVFITICEIGIVAYLILRKRALNIT